MNSIHRTKRHLLPLALTWSHTGVTHRVTAWSEVQFERLYGNEWIPISPSADVLASASQTFGRADWQPYLEFVPADVREFLSGFSFLRMEALQVVARCPALLPTLGATPAMTAFVAAHVSLRGTPAPCWAEIAAVHERRGVFGLLEWLGLPASRQTVAILQNLASPDVARRFLEPLRTLLWEPQTIFALQKAPAITDRLLEQFCYAFAA